MKIIGERETQKKWQTKKQTKAEKNKEGWKAIAKVLAIAK